MRAGIFRLVAAALASACVACGGGETPGPAAEPAPPPASAPATDEPAAQTPPQKPPQGRLRGRTPQKGAAEAKPAAPPPVRAETTVSRTAVWAGDPVLWTVDIVCAPGFDVIRDDYAGDKLKLVGLELVSSEAEQAAARDGGTIHRVRYHLRSFATNVPTLRSEPLNVRYFERKAGQRPEDLQPAGEVTIPPARIAWRSTIPDGSFQNGVLLRDARQSESAPRVFNVARPIGWSLVLISIAPVVLWTASTIQHARRPREKKPSARATRNETRNALNTLRTSAPSGEGEVREAYTRLSTTLRHHVAATTGVTASALASDELGERLKQRGSRVKGDDFAELLAECDRARYAAPGGVPPSDRFQESVSAAERLV